MHRIPHDPLDVMTVLEVESQFDEDAFCEFYLVKRNDLTLDVALFLTEPRAQISLRREDEAHPLVSFSFWCGHIGRVVDGRGELLAFSNCVVGNVGLDLDDVTAISKLSMCSIFLWIKPQIRIQVA